MFRYGLKPVPGTALDSLDQRHLRDYFGRVLSGSVPPANDVDQWQRLLQNLELATHSSGHIAATIDGMLLFGKNLFAEAVGTHQRLLCWVVKQRRIFQITSEKLAGGGNMQTASTESGSSGILQTVSGESDQFPQQEICPTRLASITP